MSKPHSIDREAQVKEGSGLVVMQLLPLVGKPTCLPGTNYFPSFHGGRGGGRGAAIINEVGGAGVVLPAQE